MCIRLVALDIDGTLLNPAGELTSVVRETVQRVRSLGVQVVLTTGRRLRTTLPILQALGLTGPVITHNGATVLEAVGGAAIRRAMISPTTATIVMQHLQNWELPYWAYRHEVQKADVLVPFGLGPGRFPWPVEPAHWTYVAEGLDEPVISLTTWGEHERLQQAAAALATMSLPYELLYSPDHPCGTLDILPPDTSKATGLAALCDHLCISADQVLAVGDGYNDISMLRWAGCSIAMGQAPAAVLAAARNVTASNTEDGVALALRTHLLGERSRVVAIA